MEILKIENLTVTFNTEYGELVAVKNANLSLNQGEILGLVGESGCGKTVLCKSMLHLLCNRGMVKEGRILFENRDIVSLRENDMEELYGKEIAMIFQDPMTSLNPSVAIGEQIAEVIFLHEKVTKAEVKQRVLDLLELVGIDFSEKRFGQMPYEFSGGMRQRVAIAIALAGNPKILLADEPTTALDGQTQSQILTLLRDIQKKTDVAIVFITHDLSLVEEFAGRVAVMLDGAIVEEGTVSEIFDTPKHEYTKRLMRYVNYGKGKEHVHGKIKEAITCDVACEESKISETSRIKNENLLEIQNLCMSFKLDRHTKIKVMEDFSLNVRRGEIVGLIGSSGVGKSTLARCIMGIYKPTGGSIAYYGKNKQIIFQDSMSALNPRMTVEEIIEEPLRIQNNFHSKGELKEKILKLLNLVELDEKLIKQHPYEISGGQRQRVAIARAISVDPDLIVADEPIASLDVSVQAQIVHLFSKLQKERNLSILLISHDVPMVEHVSDRIEVMLNCK